MITSYSRYYKVRSHDITGVMVTGKTTKRYPIALGAVRSFLSQEYSGRKLLLIINDNPIPLFPDHATIPPGVVELHVRHEQKYTLGELRNMAFDHVATDGYMVQWDDDDWSHPHRLQYQVDNTTEGCASILKWQVQYDLRTGRCFAGCGREAKVGGFAGTMLFPASTTARFSLKPKGEDTDFLVDLRKAMELKVLITGPTIFMHFCHENNTWHPEHVMKRRRGSRELKPHELADVKKVIQAQYSWAA